MRSLHDKFHSMSTLWALRWKVKQNSIECSKNFRKQIVNHFAENKRVKSINFIVNFMVYKQDLEGSSYLFQLSKILPLLWNQFIVRHIKKPPKILNIMDNNDLFI